MTVEGNISFGLRLRRLSRGVIAEKVERVLDLVGLAGYARRYPRQLSGGQQQRVALARSLVLQPKILLLDEPFSSLDAHLRVRLREELKTIQRQLGLTTLFVTHDQEEAMVLADRIALMHRGAVEQIGPPTEIYDRPATLFAAATIGTMNILPARRVGDRLVAGDIEVACPGRPSDKEPVLALRPEDCELVADDTQGTCAGTVEQVVTLGSVRIATVALAGGIRLKVQVGRRLNTRAGAAVSVRIGRLLVYFDGGSPVEVAGAVAKAQPPAAAKANAAEAVRA